MPDLGSQELKAICNIIADTNKGLTKTELTHLLGHCMALRVTAILTRLALISVIGFTTAWLTRLTPHIP